MGDDDQQPVLEILTCEKCGSKNVRTTKYYRICIRCGHREDLK